MQHMVALGDIINAIILRNRTNLLVLQRAHLLTAHRRNNRESFSICPRNTRYFGIKYFKARIFVPSGRTAIVIYGNNSQRLNPGRYYILMSVLKRIMGPRRRQYVARVYYI